MAKSSGRIALYELVNKARFKSAQEKALSHTSQKAEQALVEPVEPQTAPDVKIDRPWGTRPRTVRLYPDRIELCISWQVTVIGLLALAAILMVFFRLGQIYSLKKSAVKEPIPSSIATEKIMPQPKVIAADAAEKSEQKPLRMVEPMGDHVIVIATYGLNSHLEPVKQYFAGFGIATEIIKKDSHYLLVTRERFDNPDKAGTNGFEMKNKIISIGAKYKPPASSGFESFGKKPFQDAYGMKIN